MRGLFALTCLALACAHQPRPPSTHGWRELRSAHFRLRTDLQREDTRRTLENLETLRAALQAVWTEADGPDAPGSTLAIVLRDRAELATFTPLSGLATLTWRGPLLVASGRDVTFGDVSPQLELLAHEVAHGLNRRWMPSAPRWFDEGLAAYLETAEVIDVGRVRLGATSREDLEQARTRPFLPLDVLAAARWEEATPTELQDIYRSARLWVHLLRSQEPARMRTLETALRRGAPWRTAWAEFREGLDTSRLEETLRLWLHAGTFPTELRRFTPPSFRGDERPLAPWEVHVTQAALWAAVDPSGPKGGGAGRGRAELEAAARLAPTEALPRVLLADLETDPERRLQSATALRRAFPTSPEAAVFLARVLRDDGGPVEGRRAAMLDAVVLAPEDVDALTAHALEEARAGELARAFQTLRQAEALAPWNPGVFVIRAAVLAPLGYCGDAVDAVQRAMDVLPDGVSPDEVTPLVRERARIQTSCRPAHGP